VKTDLNKKNTYHEKHSFNGSDLDFQFFELGVRRFDPLLVDAQLFLGGLSCSYLVSLKRATKLF
jgi:hypothetical protein